MGKVKIAIVDNHKILRDGLKLLLQSVVNYEVVIDVSNGQEFIDKLEDIKPDLSIIDLKMPVMSGDVAVKLAREKYPNLKIVILTMVKNRHYFELMKGLGVDAYISKETGFDELEFALKTVLKGGKYFSQDILLDLVVNSDPIIDVKFSKREKEVLYFLCKGYSTNEIAQKLFITTHTVEKHRSALLRKTGSSNSVHLVVFAIKNGFFSV